MTLTRPCRSWPNTTPSARRWPWRSIIAARRASRFLASVPAPKKPPCWNWWISALPGLTSMKKFKLLILAVLLASCGPMYQTNYEIVPPQSETGRMCANNCLLSKSYCEQSCRMEQSHCESRARLESRNDYLEYVTVQNATGKPVVRSSGDFRRYYNCSPNACEARCGE